MLQTVLTSEDAHTSNHKSARKQPIVVITRGERRRRWTAEQKQEIAAESLEPGASAVMVARKHGISRGQLYTWRQELLRGAVGAAAEARPNFVRVNVVASPPRLEAVRLAVTELDRSSAPIPPSPAPPSPAPPAAWPDGRPDGRIEITLTRGVTVRVDAKVDAAALRRVLAALERP